MNTNSCLRVLAVAALLLASALSQAGERLRVVATIKPLQLLVVAVGGDAVQAELLLQPNQSPHDYQLRPSDRRRLDAADTVVWIGPQLEVFLQSVLIALPPSIRIVALHDGAEDPHLWLDPIATAAAAQRLAAAFSELRPQLAAQFRANANRVQQQLLQEDALLRQQLAAAGKLRGYLVEHDAYRRFEQRYGLQHRAALTDSSDLPPSPAQIARLQQLLDDGEVGCVLRERYESRAMSALLSGRRLKVEVIDALAVDQPVTAEGLLLFYRRLGRSILDCLSD